MVGKRTTLTALFVFNFVRSTALLADEGPLLDFSVGHGILPDDEAIVLAQSAPSSSFSLDHGVGVEQLDRAAPPFSVGHGIGAEQLRRATPPFSVGHGIGAEQLRLAVPPFSVGHGIGAEQLRLAVPPFSVGHGIGKARPRDVISTSTFNESAAPREETELTLSGHWSYGHPIRQIITDAASKATGGDEIEGTQSSIEGRYRDFYLPSELGFDLGQNLFFETTPARALERIQNSEASVLVIFEASEKLSFPDNVVQLEVAEVLPMYVAAESSISDITVEKLTDILIREKLSLIGPSSDKKQAAIFRIFLDSGIDISNVYLPVSDYYSEIGRLVSEGSAIGVGLRGEAVPQFNLKAVTVNGNHPFDRSTGKYPLRNYVYAITDKKFEHEGKELLEKFHAIVMERQGEDIEFANK